MYDHAVRCFTKSSSSSHLSMGTPGYTLHHDGLVLLLNLKSIVFLLGMNLQRSRPAISSLKVSTLTSGDESRILISGEITEMLGIC